MNNLLLLAGSPALAQERRLTVVVADPSGATIPRASIVVLAGSDLIAEHEADANGVALVTLRATRALTLIVTAPGFATEEVDVAFPRGPPPTRSPWHWRWPTSKPTSPCRPRTTPKRAD